MNTQPPRIFLSPPWVGQEERDAVQAAFDSGYVAPCGPQVEAFEQALARQAGRRFGVAVSSGTAALDLIFAHLGVDETWTVIAPTLTFIATVGPAWHRGAQLVLVDCDRTGTLDCDHLDFALSRVYDPEHTVVIGVDLYGQCCDYARIVRMCEKIGVKLVMDSAEAVGATYEGQPAGSVGFAAIYSFNGNKILTTSGGGVLVTDSPELAEHARKLSQQAREPVPWYEHCEVGYNYRLSNILAAIGLAQLAKLPQILRKRAENAAFYSGFFPGRLLPTSNHWLSVAILDTPEEAQELAKRFAAANIETRPVWKPLHLQPVFDGVGIPCLGGEVAEDLFRRGICLPSGTGLSADDFARIRSVIEAK
ncbi:MAG TPA: hypothetical protein DDY72_00405 [Verrucomicrobia bacterium]|nr:hypothetical protein [Verrucomicrobiota bacterium]